MSDPLQTPIMIQYRELKSQVPDAFLFFRMGDFYELFLGDAEEAAPLMDVALTRRQAQIPMAGVPYHSADIYISRLLSHGCRVAIAEQEADPENPRLMRRVIRRVISPGMIVEENLLSPGNSNYLAAVARYEGKTGLAFLDISTGDFFSFLLSTEDPADYLARYAPGEIIVASDLAREMRSLYPAYRFEERPDWQASPSEGLSLLERRSDGNAAASGFREASAATAAIGLVEHYLKRAFPENPPQSVYPVLRQGESHMFLDEETIRHLDLVQSEAGSDRTLFFVLNQCQTAGGKRYLRRQILEPLLDIETIENRQEEIQIFYQDSDLAKHITQELKGVADMERILSRLQAERSSPRDLAAIQRSLRAALSIASLYGPPVASELSTLKETLDRMLLEEVPPQLGKGPFLKEGVEAELDLARKAGTDGANWILALEERERASTQINNLKIRYNKISGYYIEISKGQVDRVPAHYQRRQTLVNAERYTTEELNAIENRIQSADETIAFLERKIFQEIKATILAHERALRLLAAELSRMDMLLSLAHVALRRRWVRPHLHTGPEHRIIAGRHPVVEHFRSAFVPNTLEMDARSASCAIITGPNMAGKSTYIKQAALIGLLAQMGSFVPASEARLRLVDRIFTRMGSGDNISRGESTFYIEMLETARILRQSSSRSFVIMDEVGRGTSTYDGLAIAWAVVEELTGDRRPLLLFATHYHELTALGGREGVFNLTMDILEDGGKITFLHQVRAGAADRSYGIHVARLAGLPAAVTQRAEEKLAELEARGVPASRRRSKMEKPQLDLFS
ncbi:MAG: DNA mismatch repair protein MutS [Spirochaetales bacterium]|nr:DNA mismatch repair protein MutS [Spirochaetales bacterium]